jgi:SAM-dependent MidA family methyltransferase
MASIPTGLPTPDADAQLRSQQLAQIIQQTIQKSQGWISFAEFMQMALYTPSLGYYSGGAQKFGDVLKGGGDFITAPELTPLFGLTVANQVAEVLAQTGGDVLELGAGTGKMALNVLQGLHVRQQLPNHYYILDVSAHLRHVQKETLQAGLPPEVLARVKWLDTLPEQLTGVVLGNEVLDAIAVHLVLRSNGKWLERGVSFEDGFQWQDRVLQNQSLVSQLPDDLPDGYLTEVCPAAHGLIASIANNLQQGMILMLDYGFGAREYYHLQRNQGTLMCHYQHHSQDNPLILLGLQDITAHVNFTTIAETALENGLECKGYVNQAQFLINAGITNLLKQIPNDLKDGRYLREVSALQKLVSPAEMGELFKVIALTKGISTPLIGFVQGDKRHML